MWLALLTSLALVQPRPFTEERHLLDRQLETLRRILPDGPHAAVDIALVKDLAAEVRLVNVSTRTRPPENKGSLGWVALDVEGQGRYADISRFFDLLAASHRLVDTEELTLTSTAGLVHFESVVRLPYRPLNGRLPAPPDGVRADYPGASRQTVQAFVRDQALALDKSQTVANWRRARRNPRLFLSELGAAMRDRPVVVSFASLGDEFLVRGMTVGEAPVRELQRRMEGGFFRVAEFLMARQGGCVRFEVRGRSPVVGPEAALPLPSDDPFIQDDTPCRVDRDTGRRIKIRGGSRGRGVGDGPLTLRMRDVDLADVLHALHVLTGKGFLADWDVTGRTDLDLDRMKLEGALKAIRKAAKLQITQAGHLRRVALETRSAAPPLASNLGGAKTSFALKRAEVRDILAVMSEADSSLAVLGPAGFLGRLSLWAHDLPLLDVRAAVLQAVELLERTEDGQRIVSHATRQEEEVEPVAAREHGHRLVLAPEDMTVMEFLVAGVGSVGVGWTAFAYSPSGTLYAFRPGDSLADGSVKSISGTGVVLTTDQGPLRVALPPLPR